MAESLYKHSDNYFSEIHQTSDSGYILAGRSPDDFLTPSSINSWALKLDVSGNIEWQKRFNGPLLNNFDSFHAIYETPDGGFVIGGYTDSTGFGETEILVIKLDENGDMGNCLPFTTGYFSATALGEEDVVVENTTVTPVTQSGEATPETSEVVIAALIRSNPCGSLEVDGVIDLPATGQTECYGMLAAEGVIPCEGTGQDGEYQMGVVWPEPRFVLNSGEGTITDRLTGLMWAQDAGTPTVGDGACTGRNEINLSGVEPWQYVLDYITCLNDGSGSTNFEGNYLGYDDWRLPNEHELFSLINVSYYNEEGGNFHTYIDWLNELGFTSLGGHYWSSTTAVPFWNGYFTVNDHAWTVYAPLGTEAPHSKYGTYNCTPVRTVDVTAAVPLPRTGQTACYDEDGGIIDCDGTGQDGEYQNGPAWPEPRFFLNIDATVTDRLTGLIWTADARASEGGTGGDCDHCIERGDALANWQEALDYVACLNGLNEGEGYLGYNDWRLPNVYELRSLIDFSRTDPGLPLSHPFSSVNKNTWYNRGGYWTSTTHFPAGTCSRAWLVGFGDSRAVPEDKGNVFSVWPVRGGEKDTSCLEDTDSDGTDPTDRNDPYDNSFPWEIFYPAFIKKSL